MGTVVIREYGRVAESHFGHATIMPRGVLVTDETGLPIKVVTTVVGTAVDSVALSGKTHFVALEGNVQFRYAVRPKGSATPLPATDKHEPCPLGSTVFVAVHGGAVISILEY